MKNTNLLIIIGLMAISLLSVSFLTAQTPDFNVCCERTLSGAFCQNTDEDQCDPDFRKTPTSCEATSFCKLGICVDTEEGICTENTPQRVCDESQGSWFDDENPIPQCSLGCCLIGNQASFVTLTRCKQLSNLYGLETNYRVDVTNEVSCIQLANSQDQGACVFTTETEVSCKFTTRADCNNIQNNNQGNSSLLTNKTGFFKDFLCSADELATSCGPTTETICVDGKEEVYFKDSCGNPANIYDASKIYSKDSSYWQKVVSKSNSCGFNSNSGNAGSTSCGNCEYFKGSICSKGNAVHGDLICKDLNCYNTKDGNNYRNGESWCVFDSPTGNGQDPVGSRHFRHVCVNGEETIEPCADFRSEVCFQDEIETSDGSFTEAACRVNRWSDCVDQDNEDDCLNTDRRDCYWEEGSTKIPSQTNADGESIVSQGYVVGGSSCLPLVPPGLEHWEGEVAGGICSIANSKCEVVYEEGLIDFLGGEKKCIENCHCLQPGYPNELNNVCTNLGDCGAGTNIAGKFTDTGVEWRIDGQKQIVKGIFQQAA